jgi:hypothetical protein
MSHIAFEECHGKVHLLGGTLDTSTSRVIQRARILATIGYENYVVLPTFYLKLKLPDEHLRLFGECKEAVSECRRHCLSARALRCRSREISYHDPVIVGEWLRDDLDRRS